MGVFDQAARFAGQAEPGFVLTRLRQELGLELTFRRWFPTRTVPLPGGPDREADLVALADDTANAALPWLLIFEFQAQHDPAKIRVLFLETLVFLCHAVDTDRNGGALAPVPVFVYLRGRCPEANLTIQTPTGRGLHGAPCLWEVEADSAQETLAQIAAGERTWGGLFWISLMSGAESEEVITEWRRLLREGVPEKQRADVAQIALIFAELAGRRRDWERVTEGLNMTESTVVNEILQQGALSEAREALRRAIQFRFPELLTSDVERAIRDQPSLELMRTWNREIFSVASAEDFLRVMRR